MVIGGTPLTDQMTARPCGVSLALNHRNLTIVCLGAQLLGCCELSWLLSVQAEPAYDFVRTHEGVAIVRKQEAALKPTTELAGRVWRQRLMRTTSLILFTAARLSVSSVTYAETVAGTSGLPPGFTLTIQDELISLRAADASLKAIFEEIGQDEHPGKSRDPGDRHGEFRM
jgi:hypothetical protein